MTDLIQNLPEVLTNRGIDEATWSALKNSIFTGARDDSILMAVDYCRARKLDPLMKPVHLVPMSVKDAATGKHNFRDVVMPGIGLYRIQAERSGNYAGSKEPEFGPTITAKVGEVEVTYPEWCKYTVSKMIGNGTIVEYSAKEYWLENYATAGRDTQAPNAMWKKRPFGQLSKCAEAQALRKGWPEIGAQPTAEEMEGKMLDISDYPSSTSPALANTPNTYPEEMFNANAKTWEKLIQSGKKKAASVIATVESKYQLTPEQRKAIEDMEVIDGNH
ncbi:phage recombination protein Bet [Paramixta manurensis]|uniref:Phage recombination protein Bet n=1 Tax=Paramixta manurensis TaxID=2740817 RepID=A0A6M8U9M2_9GAMM|nr:phage recombination protein Bet [Erwiniaceae bacterium PD-1]